MSNRKSILYRQAVLLAQRLNIQAPTWNGSSISELHSFIQNNRPSYHSQLKRRKKKLPFFTSLINRVNRRQNSLPFLQQISRRIHRIPTITCTNQDGQDLYNLIHPLMKLNQSYYFKVFNSNGIPIRVNDITSINQRTTTLHSYYDLTTILSLVLERPDEYAMNFDTNHITVQLIQRINTNPPLQNQRNNPNINCVCKIIHKHLHRLLIGKDGEENPRIRRKLNHLQQINDDHFEEGIDR